MDSYNFDKLAEAWQAPVVARSDVGKFSGGLLNPRTLANKDSLGTGPGKIVFGRKICYDTKALVEWMKKRAGVHHED